MDYAARDEHPPIAPPLADEPRRIVSLVPSLTETIAWLGAGPRLVGRTRFCTEPVNVAAAVPAVGGTKNPDIARTAALRPDLVVANREENRREDVEALRALGIPVLVTEIDTIPQALGVIALLGRLLGAEAAAAALAEEVHEALARPLPARRPRVFAAVWKEPLLAMGGRNFGHDLVERCGAINVFADRARYPEVHLDEVKALAPDLILLPDEPYRFTAADAARFATIAPAVIVDGKVCWWYGPRLPGSIGALRMLLLGGTGAGS